MYSSCISSELVITQSQPLVQTCINQLKSQLHLSIFITTHIKIIMASKSRDVFAATRHSAASMKDTRAQAQAAWAAADKDASGSLSLEEMREVLRSIMGAAPTPEQLHFFRESLDVDRSGVVTQGEFVEWYIRTAIGPQGHLLKRTLIADPVGHTRPTSYKLPPDTFTYGKGTAGNAVSAGQSM